MTRLSARTRANRRNALKSTGPRSPEGKAKVAQNARVHGLRSLKMADLSPDAARLARRIAGADADAARLALALEVAAADDAVRFARGARRVIMNSSPEPTSAYLAALVKEGDRTSELVARHGGYQLLSMEVHKGRPRKIASHPRFQNLGARLAQQMARWNAFPDWKDTPEHAGLMLHKARLLARYEDAALRRRTRAIAEFDAYCTRSSGESPAMATALEGSR